MLKLQPTIFLVGAQKAGSTSLYNWLSQHPQIFAPLKAKDIHFFSNPQYKKSAIQEFNKFYNNFSNEKVCLHGAVNYLYFQETAQKLKEISPNAKIIIILRNPFERAKSAFRYFTELGSEKRTFTQALVDEENNKNTSHEHQANFTYISHSLYYQQVKNYLQIFGKEQVKILFFEEVMNKKEIAVKELFTFLAIDNTFIPIWNYQNKSATPKIKKVNQLLVADSNFKKNIKKIIPYQKVIPLNWRIKFVEFIRNTNASNKKQALTEVSHFNEQQISIIKNDIDKLSALLQVDLRTLWKS